MHLSVFVTGRRISRKVDSFGRGYSDKDDGIIEVADIPPGNAPPQNPIVAIPDSDKDTASTSEDLDSDDDDDEDPDFQDAHDQEDEGKQNEEEQEDDNVPGLRRSKRRNRGQTTRYADYGLMMAARRTARGGQRRAIIRDGFCCFSAEDLHDAKPIPEEDHKEYALGVAMAQYLIGAGIKKIKECGEAGVSKELTQMHDMQVFRPICKDDLTYDEKKKALASLMFLKEKQDKSVKA